MRLCYNICDWHETSCRAGKTTGIPAQKEYGKKYKRIVWPVLHRPAYGTGRFAAQTERIEGAVLTKYVIRGGKPLYGEIDISGAKNAAVAIIPAALLVDGVCRIENIPQISDVTMILNILQELGADVRTVNRTTVDIDCSHIRNAKVPNELARKIRASYYLIGSLLGRFGSAQVPPPAAAIWATAPSTSTSRALWPWAPRWTSGAASSTPGSRTDRGSAAPRSIWI